MPVRQKFFLLWVEIFFPQHPIQISQAEALRNTKLTVHVSTKLNRSHLVHGKQALILPCLGRTDKDMQAGGEQFVSCENSMGVGAVFERCAEAAFRKSIERGGDCLQPCQSHFAKK
jgi:hypothetical protein